MAKNVNGLRVFRDIQVVGEEIICVIKTVCNRTHVRAEAEEKVVHRAYNTA